MWTRTSKMKWEAAPAVPAMVWIVSLDLEMEHNPVDHLFASCHVFLEHNPNFVISIAFLVLEIPQCRQ